MKKFAAGLLTALCATTFSVAQQYESNDWPQAPASEYTAPAAQEAAQPDVQSNTNTTNIYTTNNVTNVYATNSNVQTATATTTNVNNGTQAVSNEAQAVNEQPLPEYIPAPKKKTVVNVGAGASFIYGNFFGFEALKKDDIEDPTGFGGDFGVKASFVIIDGLQFSPQIMFRIFNLSHEDEGFTRYYKQTFLDFTFFMRGYITEKTYLEVGPQIAINTSSDVTIDDNFNEKIEQSPAEFGINIGVGYFVHKQVSIGFNWYMGFNEVFPDVKYYFDDDFKPSDKDNSNWSVINLKGAHTMMFKLGVTYWFL